MSENIVSQQRKSSPISSAISLGSVGALAGYFIGNRRPNLEQVFAMEPDKFERVTQNVDENLRNDLNIIEEGRKEIFDIKPENAQAFEDLLKNQKIPADSAEALALETARTNYDNAVLNKINEGKDVKITEIKKAAEEEIQKAKDAIKHSDEARALRIATDNEKLAKIKMLELSGTTDESIKNIISEYNESLLKARESQFNKFKELIQQDKYKNAFKKIKKLFPKEGGKQMALATGCIAAVIGMVLALIPHKKQS